MYMKKDINLLYNYYQWLCYMIYAWLCVFAQKAVPYFILLNKLLLELIYFFNIRVPENEPENALGSTAVPRDDKLRYPDRYRFSDAILKTEIFFVHKLQQFSHFLWFNQSKCLQLQAKHLQNHLQK